MRFSDVIDTREELRAVIGEPNEVVTRKTLSFLDVHCQTFIARAPFVLLASSDGAGHHDISPRGDPPGFVRVVDERTLVVPDRPGNRRADTMENLLENPKIGLIFLIPGKTETLRVSGTATIVQDRALLASMAVRGKAPKLGIVVHVEEAFFHCSKCMIRSGLWRPEDWPSLEGLPSLAKTMVDAGKLELTQAEMHQRVVKDEEDRLY